jgi:hypothetical protein
MRDPHIDPAEPYNPDSDRDDPNPYPNRPQWINHLLTGLIYFLVCNVPSYRRRREARLRREAFTGRR